MKIAKQITFPTWLTLLRLILAPIMVPVCMVQYLPKNDINLNLAVVILFLLFGLTDFFDGFLARKLGQESKIGATLDHFADKILTFSAFIALLAVGKISYIFVLLLVGREIFMMGLREIALEHGISIQVSAFGKLKTCVQIAAIAWIIVNPVQSDAYNLINWIELLLLIVSVGLAWFSAVQYCRQFLVQFKNKISR